MVAHPSSQELTEQLCALAVEAGAAIMDCYESRHEAVEKEDHSPVTLADKQSDRTITTGLAAITSNIPIVSEESMPTLESNPRYFFLVDPLDGTKEFINGTQEFTVNIALIDNHEPVLGVIYAPAMNCLFFATETQAFTQEITPDGKTAHAPRTITVRRPPPEGLVALVSRSHRTPETDDYLQTHKVSRFKSIGSSLKFCLIARGDADIYPRHSPTMAWDTAAGHAILKSAGGSVTTLNGQPLLYGKERSFLKNPAFIACGS
ncbi:MAG: 3'(2'),5'-bisphosphate nucleotidase CysQ [Parvularculales bacterium]